VRRLHRKAYVAGNMALSIAGRVTAAAAEALAQQHFAALPQGSPMAQGRPPVFVPGRPDLDGMVDVYPHPVRESTLQLTFEALPDGHPDFATLSLLVSLLDDGMGTRLHRALSERTGLVYAFETGLDCYRDCGLYDLELQVAPERLQAALGVAVTVLLDVAHGGVSAQELQGAKERALLAVELGQDSAEEVAQEAAVDRLFGRPGPQSYERAICRTTVADITALAQKIFLNAPRRLTLMGATTGVDGATLQRIVGRLSPPQGVAPRTVALRPPRRRPYPSAVAARRTRAAQCTAVTPRR
jgi:predicted Zn-dependent peptidase